METVDFYASEPHYVDHLAPIWEALPSEARGLFLAGAVPIREHALRRGIPDVRLESRNPGRGSLVVVASYRDELRARRPGSVFLEHGAGQHYGNRHTSYVGGPGRGNVRLFLCPNEEVARRNRATYPEARIRIVGCPKLDPWHPPTRYKGRPDPILAISFHWRCRVVRECDSAIDHYAGALRRLAEAYRGRVLGHGHPRIWRELEPLYRRSGIRPVQDFAEVLELADLYLCDNSSTIYEFASTGRPVVVLNAPWYRRHVDYGLRFWEFADVGLNADGPDELLEVIAEALEDPPAVQKRRDEISSAVYHRRDGRSSSRAAEEIVALLTSTTAGARRNQCPVCGERNHRCTPPDGARTSTAVLDLPARSRRRPRSSARYRVRRLVNGNATTLSLAAEDLTVAERRRLGIPTEADGKARLAPERHKARLAPERHKADPGPERSPAPIPADLSELDKRALLVLARDHEIEGRSRMDKTELRTALEARRDA